MILKKITIWFAVGALLALLEGCEPSEIATSVQVGTGPSFSLTGSGRLASLTVFAPLNGQKVAYPDTDVSSVVWQVQASKGYFEGTRVQGLRLTYGKASEGYLQTVPSGAQQPPVLQPGFIYSFLAESTGAPVAGGSFYLDKSGAVQVLIPDLCLMQKGGHKFRVNCATKEPFQEPSDVEKYVREHQTKQ
jgi:hypothetical protein